MLCIFIFSPSHPSPILYSSSLLPYDRILAVGGRGFKAWRLKVQTTKSLVFSASQVDRYGSVHKYQLHVDTQRLGEVQRAEQTWAVDSQSITNCSIDLCEIKEDAYFILFSH